VPALTARTEVENGSLYRLKVPELRWAQVAAGVPAAGQPVHAAVHS